MNSQIPEFIQISDNVLQYYVPETSMTVRLIFNSGTTVESDRVIESRVKKLLLSDYLKEILGSASWNQIGH